MKALLTSSEIIKKIQIIKVASKYTSLYFYIN